MKRLLLILLCLSAPLSAATTKWHHEGLRYLHGAITMMPDAHAGTTQQNKALTAVRAFDMQMPPDKSHLLYRAVRLFAKKIKAILDSYGQAGHKRTTVRKTLTRSGEHLAKAAEGTQVKVQPFIQSMHEILPLTVRTKKRRWGTWAMKGLGIAGVVALIIALMKRKQISAHFQQKGLEAIAGTPEGAQTPKDAVAAVRQGAARRIIAAVQPGKPSDSPAPAAAPDPVTAQLGADAVAAVAGRAGLPIPGTAADAPTAVRQVGHAALEHVAGTELQAQGTGNLIMEAVARRVQHAAEAPSALQTAVPHDPAVVRATADATAAVVSRVAGAPIDLSDSPGLFDTLARIAAERVAQAAEAPVPTEPRKPWFNPKTHQHFADAFRRTARGTLGIKKPIRKRRTMGRQMGSVINAAARQYAGDTAIDAAEKTAVGVAQGYHAVAGAPLAQQQSARDAALQAQQEREEAQRRADEATQRAADESAQRAEAERTRLAQEHAAEERRLEGRRIQEEAATQAAHEAELATQRAEVEAQHTADETARRKALQAAEAAAKKRLREREAAEESAAEAQRLEREKQLAAAQRQAAQAADDARIAREAEAAEAVREAAAREQEALAEERKERGAIGNLVGMSDAALHHEELQRAQEAMVEVGPKIMAKRAQLAAASETERESLAKELADLETESAAADRLIRTEQVRNPDLLSRGLMHAISAGTRARDWVRGTGKTEKAERDAAIVRASKREMKDHDRAMAYAELMREQRELEAAQESDRATVASSQSWNPLGASAADGAAAQERIAKRTSRIDELEASYEEYQSTLSTKDIERAQRIALAPRAAFPPTQARRQ